MFIWQDSDPSFTPDGRRLAVASYPGLTIFDVAKRTPVAVYPEVTNRELSGDGITAFSPDGHTIAMLDADTFNVIPLMDTDSDHGISVRVELVAIKPDKKHITTVSYGGKVAIYSIENRNLEPTVVRSPADEKSDGKRVESLSPNGLYYAFTNSQTQKVRLLDISPLLAPEVPLEGAHSDVLQLSFDSHGDFWHAPINPRLSSGLPGTTLRKQVSHSLQVTR